MTSDDRQSLEPDPQIQDDLSNWGVPPAQPSDPDYFPNDALISDEDVTPSPIVGVPRAD